MFLSNTEILILRLCAWCKDLPLEKLPEETSLQRKMKAYVLQGGKIGEAYGEIPKQH